MNRICGRIFKNKKPDFNRLIKYGFKQSSESYIMYCRILDGQFGLTVRVKGEEVDATVYDTATEDAYTLFLAEGAVGGVAVRGGAPGTRETDMLRAEKSQGFVNAVVLSGGSAYGLEAA